MRYLVECDLKDFSFWGQAKRNAERLSARQLEAIEGCMYYGDDKTEVEINDDFAYGFSDILESMGWFDTEDGIYELDEYMEWVYEVCVEAYPDVVDDYWERCFEEEIFTDACAYSAAQVKNIFSNFLQKNYKDEAVAWIEEAFDLGLDDEEFVYAWVCENWDIYKSKSDNLRAYQFDLENK